MWVSVYSRSCGMAACTRSYGFGTGESSCSRLLSPASGYMNTAKILTHVSDATIYCVGPALPSVIVRQPPSARSSEEPVDGTVQDTFCAGVRLCPRVGRLRAPPHRRRAGKCVARGGLSRAALGGSLRDLCERWRRLRRRRCGTLLVLGWRFRVSAVLPYSTAREPGRLSTSGTA
jgi:hypothetical protein